MRSSSDMASIENSPDTVPIPALLVERATALARAEAGLALVHTRRIAVRAVSALLGTIVACAFVQLTLLLLVGWPVLVVRVPLINLLSGVLASGLLGAAGAAFAIVTWVGVARERRGGAPSRPSSPRTALPRSVSSELAASQAGPEAPVTQATMPGRVAARGHVHAPAPENRATSDRPATIELAERASL